MRKGTQERRRVGVVPYEDRELSKAALPADGLPRDEVRDRVGLFSARDLLDVIDFSPV